MVAGQVPVVQGGRVCPWVYRCFSRGFFSSSRVCRGKIGGRPTMFWSIGETGRICWVWVVPPGVVGRGGECWEVAPRLHLRGGDCVYRRGESIRLALCDSCLFQLVVLIGVW